MANTHRAVAINIHDATAADWSGAAIDCNFAKTGMKVEDWNPKLKVEPVPAISPGHVYQAHSYRPLHVVEFDAVVPFQFDMGMMMLLYAGMNGAAGADQTGSYDHVMAPPGTTELIGKFCSAAWGEVAVGGASRTFRYYEIPHLKVSRIKISGQVGQLVMVTFTLIGDTITNPATVSEDVHPEDPACSVTWVDDDQMLTMTGDAFKLATIAGAPASQAISAFELDIGQNLTANHVTGTNTYIAEPHDQGTERGWTGTFSITRPRKTNAAYEQGYVAGTISNGVLDISSGVDDNALQIKMPCMSPQDTDGDIDETVTWDLFTNQTGSTPHASTLPAVATDPIEITVTNEINIDYNDDIVA